VYLDGRQNQDKTQNVLVLYPSLVIINMRKDI